jgi:hypothetical protein
MGTKKNKKQKKQTTKTTTITTQLLVTLDKQKLKISKKKNI